MNPAVGFSIPGFTCKVWNSELFGESGKPLIVKWFTSKVQSAGRNIWYHFTLKYTWTRRRASTGGSGTTRASCFTGSWSGFMSAEGVCGCPFWPPLSRWPLISPFPAFLVLSPAVPFWPSRLVSCPCWTLTLMLGVQAPVARIAALP